MAADVTRDPRDRPRVTRRSEGSLVAAGSLAALTVLVAAAAAAAAAIVALGAGRTSSVGRMRMDPSREWPFAAETCLACRVPTQWLPSFS